MKGKKLLENILWEINPQNDVDSFYRQVSALSYLKSRTLDDIPSVDDPEGMAKFVDWIKYSAKKLPEATFRISYAITKPALRSMASILLISGAGQLMFNDAGTLAQTDKLAVTVALSDIIQFYTRVGASLSIKSYNKIMSHYEQD